MKQKIEGVIVFDIEDKRNKFTTYPRASMFKDGAYISEYLKYVFVCEHTIEYESPDVDLVKSQLAALDEQEKELNLKYNQALQHIKVARNNLLAISNEQN